MNEATEPQISPAELLTARKADIDESAYNQSEEIQATIIRGRGLQELRETRQLTDLETLEALRPTRETPKLMQNTFTTMKLQFGAGYAAEENGVIGLNETKLQKEVADSLLQIEVKSHVERAEAAIDTIHKVTSYIEIIQEAERTGKKPEDILGSRRDIKQDWDTLKSNALDILLNSNTIQSICPELSKVDPGLSRSFVDQYMARDPKFRDAVLKNVDRIRQEKSFAEVEQNAEYKRAQEQEQSAVDTLVNATDNIVKLFESTGISGFKLTPEEEDQLRNAVEGKADISVVFARIRASRITANPQYKTIMDYRRKQVEVQNLQAKYEETKKNDEPGLIKDRKDDRDKARSELNALQTEFNKISDIEVHEQELNILNTLTSLASGEQYTQVGPEVRNASSALDQRIQAQETITRLQPEVQEAMRKDMRTRLAEEAGTLVDLEGLLDNAMVDVLKERYDALIGLERDKISKIQDESMKKDLQTLQAKREDRMGLKVQRDTNGKLRHSGVINYEQLSCDIRDVAFKGEEGIKRLMLRDLFGEGFRFTYEYTDGTTKVKESDLWNVVKLEYLVDAQKQRLESVYAQEHDNYLQRMTQDYFRARLDARHGDLKKLNLSKNEWEIFAQNFPGVAEAGVEAAKSESQMTAGQLDNFIQSGVVPEAQKKWLSENKGQILKSGFSVIALLAIIIGGVALSPLGPLKGIIPNFL